MARTGDEDPGRDAAGREAAPRETAASREPLVGSDPLGLGGSTAPDAPSRKPKPRVLALLGEFFRMSRTTAVLLTAFVLVGALYLLVREDPVVNFGPPAPGPEPTAPPVTEDAPTEPTDEPTAPTGATTPGAPTGTGEAGATGTAVPTGTPGTGDGTAGTGGTGTRGGDGQVPQDSPAGPQQAPGGGADAPQQPQGTG